MEICDNKNKNKNNVRILSSNAQTYFIDNTTATATATGHNNMNNNKNEIEIEVEDTEEDKKCLSNFNKGPVRLPCTGQSNFHHYFSRLGLSPMNTQKELDLLDHHQFSVYPHKQSSFSRLYNNNNHNNNNNDAHDHDKYEDDIMYNHYHHHQKTKVFLIEISQWNNKKDSDKLIKDLAIFLGFFTNSTSTSNGNHNSSSGNNMVDNKNNNDYQFLQRLGDQKLKGQGNDHIRQETTLVGSQDKTRKQQIIENICDPQYDKVREALKKSARQASTWILNYLLYTDYDDYNNKNKSEIEKQKQQQQQQRRPQNLFVTVSNIEKFTEIIKGWKNDPCEGEGRRQHKIFQTTFVN